MKKGDIEESDNFFNFNKDRSTNQEIIKIVPTKSKEDRVRKEIEFDNDLSPLFKKKKSNKEEEESSEEEEEEQGPTLEIHHIDVGQGDATLIYVRDDKGTIVRSVLIDTGRTGLPRGAHLLAARRIDVRPGRHLRRRLLCRRRPVRAAVALRGRPGELYGMRGGINGVTNVRSFGTKSCGAFAQILTLPYAGDALLMSLGNADSFTPAGAWLDGTGAEPDEHVVPIQSDLLAGRDTAYERALAWLRCSTCETSGGH
jgi:hypothetical protein